MAISSGGLSFLQFFEHLGLNPNWMATITPTLFLIFFVFIILLIRKYEIDTVKISALFLILLYASMQRLNPDYLTWFIPFFILFYREKITYCGFSLIALDIASSIWSIAEYEMEHCILLIYASTVIVWFVLIKCVIDVMREIK